MVYVFTVKEGNFNGGTLQALSEGMKNTKIIVIAMGIAGLAALPLMARPFITIQVGPPPPPPPPPVVVNIPPPAVTVTVGVPDYYVWDGYEYVGVVGSQYYYLGLGHVWLPIDPVRLARWNHWEKGHANWRVHATSNVRYRTDAQGHNHPLPKDHGH
jgi:hypothetical protein